MKKILLSLFIIILSACSTATKEETTNENAGSLKIGIIQYVEHPALDSATLGFIDGLKDNGFVEGENIVFDRQNSQADFSNAETIATKFVNDRVDLIFANATPAAQAVANKTKDIPIIITSVTNPEASGLVDSNENPNTNVSGTSDLTPVTKQLDLMFELLPETKVVGLLYSSSEENSIYQIDIAKKYLDSKNIEYKEATVSDSNSIQSVVESLVGKVDAIYIPTDNLLAEGMVNVSQVANENGLPVIVAEEGMVSKGGLATYGINYYDLGYISGKMAADVLNGKDISTMSIQYIDDSTIKLFINKTTMEKLGLSFDSKILESAELIN